MLQASLKCNASARRVVSLGHCCARVLKQLGMQAGASAVSPQGTVPPPDGSHSGCTTQAAVAETAVDIDLALPSHQTARSLTVHVRRGHGYHHHGFDPTQRCWLESCTSSSCCSTLEQIYHWVPFTAALLLPPLAALDMLSFW